MKSDYIVIKSGERRWFSEINESLPLLIFRKSNGLPLASVNKSVSRNHLKYTDFTYL